MSKIKTRLQLQNAMETEFAWRKKELHAIKTAAYLHRNSLDRDVFVRSAVAILYAHWEGFIKSVGTFYLQFVARQKLSNGELAPNFLALGASTIIDSAVASEKPRMRFAIVEFFTSRMNDRSRLNWRSGVNTKANLNSMVFSGIVMSLGLNYGPFKTKEKLIDEKLLATRNSIAHGQHMLFDLEEYMNLHTEVYKMMEEFYSQIEDAADHGRYRAAVP